VQTIEDMCIATRGPVNPKSRSQKPGGNAEDYENKEFAQIAVCNYLKIKGKIYQFSRNT
jgi:hypothetical protein